MGARKTVAPAISSWCGLLFLFFEVEGMSKPKRNQIYDAVIIRMVQEGLAKKEMDFRIAHGQDTDEELLLYLRLQARALEHTPWPKEIVGWDLITERFGGWLEAINKAELPMMSTANRMTKFQLYLDEVEFQKKMYRVRRGEKKAKSIERVKMQKARKEAAANKKQPPSNKKQTPPNTYGENP